MKDEEGNNIDLTSSSGSMTIFTDPYFESKKKENQERLEAYEICKIRGHTESGIVLTSNPPWQRCKFCGTGFRYEMKLIELDPPKAEE